MKSIRSAGLFEASLELFENGLPHALNGTYGADRSLSERGAIYTRQEVVEFILDLVGYTPDKPLFRYSILEPSVGNGDFLLPIVKRLFASIKDKDQKEWKSALSNSISAVEIHFDTYDLVRSKVISFLTIDEGLDLKSADDLVDSWIVQGDFLLVNTDRHYDFIVGNPPYVRQELIPENMLREYKRRFRTIYDRADLYIPFFEHSLSLLKAGGHLGFICADRWMKNKYGGPLRDFISKRYHLKYYIDMTDTDAFHSNVMAYPAITIISKGTGNVTRVASKPRIETNELKALSSKLLNETQNDLEAKDIQFKMNGANPWIFDFRSGTDLLRKLEQNFPLIEETGCKIGIGVATGADKAYIGRFDDLDVEEDRKLPIVMTKDILSGEIAWRGNGVINPYSDDGTLVDLRRYPRLKKHLESHKDLIMKRHVAKNNPGVWYKTIDRIFPSLTTKGKLLIPDIKGEAHVVLDVGDYYPHHNLYYITSDNWDLTILRAILLSGIATFFVSRYSPQMHGGYLRFQAQYLRKIRLPHFQSADNAMKSRIFEAIKSNNEEECREAVFDLYNLTIMEREEIKKV